MGVIEKTHATSPEGVPVNAGTHLVGVAIYPPDISLYSTLWPFVAAMPRPFDVVCQWEFVKHTHDTKLMQHCFRTQKYSRSKEGEIRGEDHNGFPNGIRFDNPLSPTAVLHHGCDDGSLSELMVSPEGDPPTPPPPANVVKMPLPEEADKIPEKFRSEPPVDAEALIPTPRRKVRY
jgi:hypothetical protein